MEAGGSACISTHSEQPSLGYRLHPLRRLDEVESRHCKGVVASNEEPVEVDKAWSARAYMTTSTPAACSLHPAVLHRRLFLGALKYWHSHTTCLRRTRI
jgi:hypothetical protein